jgi:hypothetical protein
MHKKMIGAVHSELKDIANDRIYLTDQLREELGNEEEEF